MIERQRWLAVGTAAAREAAGIVRDGFARFDGMRVETKGQGDVVTDVDRRAEQAIVARLRAAFPTHGFLAEESGASDGDTYRWIIDPIDGTLNFAHGLPHFCISIALACDGEVILAIVLDPLRGELFHAEKGGGAWLGDARLQVSACASLEQALLGAVFPKPASPLLVRFSPTLARALAHAGGVRRSGSMVLDLAYVAAGRLDGFWEFGMQPWDIAAGSLLVKEAGGVVETIDGGSDLLVATSLLACAPPLAGALRSLCRAC